MADVLIIGAWCLLIATFCWWLAQRRKRHARLAALVAEIGSDLHDAGEESCCSRRELADAAAGLKELLESRKRRADVADR